KPDIAEKTTGYVVGGISPLGQKKALPTFIHQSAETQATVCVSAGKRGLEIELSPQDLARLTRGQFADLCQEDA
ncbi:MAG: YbaK/EbsC family protein, partial [Shewanella sp.]